MVTAQFDTLSNEELRNVVGKKWSTYPDCIGAFVAEMDFGTAPEIQQALREVVDEGFFGYVRDADVEAMRVACANWYRTEYGWNIPVDRVRSLADVIMGLRAAITEFSPPGARVIVPTPAYMPFLSVPVRLGREIIEVPMVVANGRWEFDFESIDAAFAGSANGGLLALCNPCNPVGRVFSREELLKLGGIVAKHGGRVFADEIHAPLLYPGQHHIPYASISETTASHTLTAVSASKAWNLAGLKSAQLILSNDIDAERWREAGFLIEHGASTIGVIANAAAYASGKPWLDDVIDYLDGNRGLLGDLLAEHLPRVGYIKPEGTYLAWLDFRDYPLPDDLAEFFRDEAKVAVVDGKACGAIGEGFVRFNIAMSSDTLHQAIRQMASAVNAAASS